MDDSMDIIEAGPVVDTLGDYSLHIQHMRVRQTGRTGWMPAVMLSNSAWTGKLFNEDQYDLAREEGCKMMKERKDTVDRQVRRYNLCLQISLCGRRELPHTVAAIARPNVPLSVLVGYMVEALNLGEPETEVARLSGLPESYTYAIATYRRRRSASQIAAVISSMPENADHDTVDAFFCIADTRMPVMVLLFGKEPWLDEDEIRALLPDDERNAPIRIHRVMTVDEAEYYLNQVKLEHHNGYLRLLVFGQINTTIQEALGLMKGPIP